MRTFQLQNQNKNKKRSLPELPKATVSISPPFYFSGVVKKGKARARQLGFPTVNLEVKNLTIPYGVYVVLAKIGEEIVKGVANLGIAKTFDETRPRLEIHLLDFNRDLLHQKVELNFLKLLRQVRKFQDPETLVNQVRDDIKIAKDFLKNL